MPEVSVVIISKNEAFLDETLRALRDQCQDMGAECVVVDASHGGLDAVRDANGWVRWHAYSAPEGRSVTIPHQRNLGVALAEGDVIAFCDSGGVPDEGWLARLTQPILAGDAIATGGPIRSARPTATGTINEVPRGESLPSVVTSNFAFHRRLFDRLGGFDERYDYGSDGDFGVRIRGLGETVVSVPDAGMTVDWGDRRRQLRRALRYGEAQAREWLLHPERRRRIVVETPEVIVYPALFLTLPIALVAAIVTRRWVLAVPWASAVIAIYGWDLGHRRPSIAMVDHVVVSIGILRELLAAAGAPIDGRRSSGAGVGA